jgi:hypothetical protein
VAVAAHAVVQLSTATPAAALTGLTVFNTVTDFGFEPVKRHIVDCPGDTVVVGGGAWIDQPNAPVVLTMLLPHTDDFVAEAMATGQIVFEWRMFVQVICARRPPGYQIVSRATGFSSSTFKAVDARCPSGTRVIGSGAGIDQSPFGVTEVGLHMVRPDGALTMGRANAREDANGFSGTWQLTALAICIAPVGQQNSPRVGPGSLVSVRCPPDTLVHGLGGGGSTFDDGPFFLTGLRLDTTSPPFRSVTARMSGAPAQGLVAQATCAA